MYGWFGMTQAQLEAYQRGETPPEHQSKDQKEKAEQAAADAKKTPEERLQDGFRACKEAGRKLPKRILGIVDRETGKMTDQFTVMEGHEEEVSRIIMASFLEHLDKELKERGLLSDEEEDEQT